MPKGVTSNDLFDLSFVSDPQLSPDGRRAAVVLTRIIEPTAAKPSDEAAGTKTNGDEPQAPRYQSRVQLLHLGGQERPTPIEFTRSEYSDRSPRFSPSGAELGFLSVREEKGKAQLYLLSLTGGEARRLTEHRAGVEEFAFQPGGRAIAYTSRGEWHDEVAKRGEARLIRKRHWRLEGVGVLPDAPITVYLLDPDSGESRELAELADGASNLVFSPDGATLYLITPSAEDSTSFFRDDVIAIDLASGTKTTVLERVLVVNQLAPSPDGGSLAYCASFDQDDFVSAQGVWVLPVTAGQAAGEPRLISGQIEVQPSVGGDSRYGAYPNRPVWVDAGAALLVNVNEAGASALRRLSLTGASERLHGGERVVTTFASVTPAGAAPVTVFIAETPLEPGELHQLREDGSERRLSGFNDAWRRRLTLHAPTGPHPAGEAGAPYWLIAPKLPRSDGAAVVEVHGGPATNYGYGFQFEFQLLASRGYAVIYGNPRGSTSYGHDFTTAMLGAYGTVDADDVLAFARAGRERLGRPDAPLHLTGGSYGGFMTNWLVGHTELFTSAVTQRSISNWTSMYGTSDIGPLFVERQLAGVAWGDVEALWRQSPIRYADAITTPLLIIHSEEDHRCPIEQAEQLFTVLKHLGRAETEFLRVPGEGHELSRSGRPDRRIARLEAIVAWFERHADRPAPA